MTFGEMTTPWIIKGQEALRFSRKGDDRACLGISRSPTVVVVTTEARRPSCTTTFVLVYRNPRTLQQRMYHIEGGISGYQRIFWFIKCQNMIIYQKDLWNGTVLHRVVVVVKSRKLAWGH